MMRDITPHKGGRTEIISPARCTSEVRAKLDALKERTGASEADLWEEKVLWEHGDEIELSDGRRYLVRSSQTDFDRRILQGYIESAISDAWDNKLLVLPTDEEPALELTQRYWNGAAYVVEIEEPDSFDIYKMLDEKPVIRFYLVEGTYASEIEPRLMWDMPANEYGDAQADVFPARPVLTRTK